MLRQRIGMIGAGQMATALAQGFIRSGLVPAEAVMAADPSLEARQRFAEATQSQTTHDNLKVVAASDVIILAVKPQQIGAVAEQLRGGITPGQLVVSVAAGIRIQVLAKALGSDVRVVRVMPNTPCLVGHGACGFCLGAAATQDDAQLVARLLGAVGKCYQVEEDLLDAVTGLSGSGPAFVYVMIEALSDGGVRVGLPRAVAAGLAAQTVLGAAQMVLSTGEHPGVLKDRVASPGGTTIAGLKALERGGLRAALIEAVEAAARRSAELGAVS